ncbi:MAG: hypothetical protein HZB53_10010 [Chloroflexi bacterium]|nr:hypothetical protein [Chloroflexota bacterium]
MRIICWFLLAALAAACAPGVTPPSPSPAAPTAPVMATPAVTAPSWLAIAHRGGAGLAPENTLAAFRNGIALGADVIEMDAHLSRDGVLVVIHDPTLERTTDGKGSVADRTLAELQALNAAARFGDGRYERQPVPAFTQVLDLLRDNRVRAEVEIKAPPQGRYAGIEAQMVQALSERNLLGRVSISSFDFGVLADVKRADASAHTVALMTADFFRRIPVDMPAQVIAAAQAAGAGAIAVNKDYLTAAMVQEAHARGLLAEVWTVDSEAEMRKFAVMGVDGIITNRPDTLLRLRNQ